MCVCVCVCVCVKKRERGFRLGFMVRVVVYGESQSWGASGGRIHKDTKIEVQVCVCVCVG